jgi:hypothetical protein
MLGVGRRMVLGTWIDWGVRLPTSVRQGAVRPNGIEAGTSASGPGLPASSGTQRRCGNKLQGFVLSAEFQRFWRLRHPSLVLSGATIWLWHHRFGGRSAYYQTGVTQVVWVAAGAGANQTTPSTRAAPPKAFNARCPFVFGNLPGFPCDRGGNENRALKSRRPC